MKTKIFDLRGNLIVEIEAIRLDRADMRNLDLRNADLRGLDLCYVDFRGANLTGADLTGADVRCAYITREQISSAITDKTTYLPVERHFPAYM